jgi:hypothetical protein
LKLKLNQIEWKDEIKKHVGYNIGMILCALLAIACLVLSIVALFSTQRNEGIAVKEAFDVSSAPLDAVNQNFVTQLSGYIVNYEDEKAQVDKILVVVGNGRDREQIELDGMVLYPRLAEEIRHEWKTSFNFDRIHSVTVVVDGENRLLANNTVEWEFNPNVILYVLLCAVSCLGTVIVSKKRYYRYQEDQMLSSSTEE